MSLFNSNIVRLGFKRNCVLYKQFSFRFHDVKNYV